MTLDFKTYRSPLQYEALQITHDNIEEVHTLLRNSADVYEVNLREVVGKAPEITYRLTSNSGVTTVKPGSWISSDLKRLPDEISTWEDLTPTTGPAEPEPHGVYLVNFKRVSVETQHVYVDVDDLISEKPDFLNDLYAEAHTTPEETPLAELLEWNILEIISNHDLKIHYDAVLEDDAEEVTVSKEPDEDEDPFETPPKPKPKQKKPAPPWA